MSHHLFKACGLFDFHARDEAELSIEVGHTYWILDNSDEDWWKGESVKNSKCVGYFPAKFVEDITSWNNRVIAIFDFEQNGQRHLKIHKGDIINVKNINSQEEWWFGELNESVGFFPSSYVSTYFDQKSVSNNENYYDDYYVNATLKIPNNVALILNEKVDKSLKELDDEIAHSIANFVGQIGKLMKENYDTIKKEAISEELKTLQGTIINLTKEIEFLRNQLRLKDGEINALKRALYPPHLKLPEKPLPDQNAPDIPKSSPLFSRKSIKVVSSTAIKPASVIISKQASTPDNKTDVERPPRPLRSVSISKPATTTVTNTLNTEFKKTKEFWMSNNIK